jgi:CubicO group peptidase (beta-lactamase class C family)
MEQERLDAVTRDLLDRHGLPGMAVGVLDADGPMVSAAGTRNAFTGDPATPDTLFQIGSITKMYTATLIMQLVDDGVISLDAPVTEYLPDLRLLGDPDLSAVTVLSLVTHTSGIEGDSFFDTGRGDDAIERIIPRLAAIGMIHEPGAHWSYCNTGMVLAGRIVEVSTGLPWHRALTERIVDPLGVRTPVTLLDEVVTHRAAVGHLGVPGEWTPARLATMPWSQAPAGSRSFGNVGDLLAFAAMHCDGGRAADGTRILSPESVALMQSHMADQPASLTKGQGIGWFLLDEAPDLVVGHAGDTVGFSSLLVVVPHRRVAVASLVNTSAGVGANFEAALGLVAEAAGVQVSPPGSIPAGLPMPDLQGLAGEYRRVGESAIVRLRAGTHLLDVTLVSHDELRGTREVSLVLQHASGPVFVDADDPASFPFEFSASSATGRPDFFVVGARLLRRVG